ncbi:hypothetical protein AB0L06_42695 [Spirillospora sp. NPDC052269]
MFAASDLREWRSLLDSLPDCFGRSLSAGPLPERLVEALLEGGRSGPLQFLADNDAVVGGDVALQIRLTATGVRDVVHAVDFGGRRWSLRACREALAAPRPGDDWTTRPHGVLEQLNRRSTSRRRAQVVCPVDGAARATLADVGSELTRAEQLRALLTVHDHDGGLARLSDIDRSGLRPAVAEVLRIVLADGDVAVLHEAVAVAEGTDGLIEELYEDAESGDLVELLGLRDHVDWEAVRRAHADRPFVPPVLQALTARADCPADLREVASSAEVAAGQIVPPALVAEHLGDDVEAWRTVRARLPRYRGDLADLLAEAGAEAAVAKKKGAKTTSWPGAGDLPAWDAVASVSGTRAKFVALLDLAPVETQLKLLKHFDDRTVADLFGQGAWHDEWLDFAMRARPKRYRLALAQRPSITAEAIETLMGQGDPVVNARLFIRNGATGLQRERLLSGRIDKGLVERLLKRDGGFRARDAVSCSDERLQRYILSMVRVRGITPQLRLLLNLWDRKGPAAVRHLLDNEPEGLVFSRKVIRKEVRGPVTKLLAKPDPAEALAELRATVTEAETAEAQLDHIRENSSHPSAEVFREAHLWHWDELVAAHRRGELGTLSLLGLSGIPECPQPVRDEAGRRRWRWIEYTDTLIEDETPKEILGGHPASWWLCGAVDEGVVTWEQVIALAHPADKVLETMSSRPDAVAALAPLVREHLDPSRDAWALALRMLPTFSGTVADLVRTAALATTPPA